MSSLMQTIAALPEPAFEPFTAQAKGAVEELTTSVLLRKVGTEMGSIPVGKLDKTHSQLFALPYSQSFQQRQYNYQPCSKALVTLVVSGNTLLTALCAKIL